MSYLSFSTMANRMYKTNVDKSYNTMTTQGSPYNHTMYQQLQQEPYVNENFNDRIVSVPVEEVIGNAPATESIKTVQSIENYTPPSADDVGLALVASNWVVILMMMLCLILWIEVVKQLFHGDKAQMSPKRLFACSFIPPIMLLFFMFIFRVPVLKACEKLQ